MFLDFTEFHVNETQPMYVQRWNLAGHARSQRRLVIIHGGTSTGAVWTTTPEGKPGWARRLAAENFEVFVVDWPGCGRSRPLRNFLTSGPAPLIEALAALLDQIGPSGIVAHSIGAAIAVKLIECVPHLVTSFIAIAPAPPGNLPSAQPAAPLDQPIEFDQAAVARFFTNADNFHDDDVPALRRGMTYLSPSVMNAAGAKDGSHALTVREPFAAKCPRSLVLAGDQDALVPGNVSRSFAEFVGADYVLVGRDWGCPGFGHWMFAERGSEALLSRLLEWMLAR